MKIIVASDIHGSYYYTKKFVNILEKENPDQIILLGDVFYHGPRNKLPKGYNPMEVSKSLNKLANILKCTKGNCDAEVDQMIADFKFEDKIELTISKKKFLFVHGHNLDFENLPENYDFIFGGHTHVNSIKNYDKTTYINPGSLSIPKENTKSSYAVIDDKTISIFDIKGNLIQTTSIN